MISRVAFGLLVVFLSGCDQTGGEATVVSSRTGHQDRTQRWEEQASEILSRGNTLEESGRHDEALQLWDVVISDFAGSTSWGKAIYNRGIVLGKLDRHKEAVEAFQRLLATEVNNREPGDNLMEMYRNYHYQACLGVSREQVALGNLPAAHESLVLARDKYRYQSGCGTCNDEERARLNRQIAGLEEQLRQE